MAFISFSRLGIPICGLQRPPGHKRNEPILMRL